jgi:hypothetical protein
VHDLGDHVVGFLSYGALGCLKPYGFDEFRIRPACMDPATGDVKIRSFLAQCVVYLISIGDHGSGEILKEFPWMVVTP